MLTYIRNYTRRRTLMWPQCFKKYVDGNKLFVQALCTVDSYQKMHENFTVSKVGMLISHKNV